MTCSRTEARSGARISSVFGTAVFKWVGTWRFLLPDPFLALPQSGGSGELEILVFTEKHLVEHWKCSLIICCWIFLFKTTAVVRANCTKNFIIIGSIHAQATESGLCVWSLYLDGQYRTVQREHKFKLFKLHKQFFLRRVNKCKQKSMLVTYCYVAGTQ